MDDGVVAALQERAVDGAIGVHAVLGKTTGKGHRMPLADAHVKGTSGHRFEHHRHRCSTRHGGGDAHNLIVLLGQFHKGLAKDVLVLDGAALAALGAFAGLLVKLAWSVPCGRIGLGSGKALALDRANMHQFGAGHVLDFAEYLHQTLHVMAVIQSEIADVQALKDVLLA